MFKQTVGFFKKNPTYNAVVHLITGVGLGILATYPLVKEHPVRVGAAFLIVGLCGHLYPYITKK